MRNTRAEERKRFGISLVVVSLVIVICVLFVGTYLLSVFLLTECLEETPIWLSIPILMFDVLWIVLIRFSPFSRRVKVISTLLVLTVSAAVLFAMLCARAIPV